MNRRSFLKLGGAAAVASFVVPSMILEASNYKAEEIELIRGVASHDVIQKDGIMYMVRSIDKNLIVSGTRIANEKFHLEELIRPPYFLVGNKF